MLRPLSAQSSSTEVTAPTGFTQPVLVTSRAYSKKRGPQPSGFALPLCRSWLASRSSAGPWWRAPQRCPLHPPQSQRGTAAARGRVPSGRQHQNGSAGSHAAGYWRAPEPPPALQAPAQPHLLVRTGPARAASRAAPPPYRRSSVSGGGRFGFKAVRTSHSTCSRRRDTGDLSSSKGSTH